MNLVKAVFLLLYFVRLKGNLLLPKSDKYQKTKSFVFHLLQDLNTKTSKSDVVLLPFGFYKDSKAEVDDIFESIASKLSENNVVIIPTVQALYKNQGIKKADVILIISDPVSLCCFVL